MIMSLILELIMITGQYQVIILPQGPLNVSPPSTSSAPQELTQLSVRWVNPNS